ncbi:MAG: hydrogenase maturation protease [candidate division WOR-3 bacterium]
MIRLKTFEKKDLRKKYLILGLGNTIRGDDGIGIYLTKFLEKKFLNLADIISTEEMGLSLIDFLSPYEKAVIIDSIFTGKKDIGEIYIFKQKDFDSKQIKSNHYIGLPEIYKIAKKLKIPFPKELLIIGISVEDPYTIKPELSENLKKKIPEIITKIEKIIRDFLK